MVGRVSDKTSAHAQMDGRDQAVKLVSKTHHISSFLFNLVFRNMRIRPSHSP